MPCRDGKESECWGLTKDKTWCDSQHYPKDTVILQAQFCKHLRAANNYCPTCGTVFDDTQDRDGGDGPIYDISPGAFIEPVEYDQETQRDIEDNYIVEERDDTIYVEQSNYPDQTYTRPVKRSIIPRRNKETPSS